ncbi:MAG: hypothetical protein KDC85_17280 [Saprospiraceae bacterium]|nr:hypothetical protein [Saprospiraceae bacterium]MCB9327003.1 hypothetical protein [Lewinellaceae bacterium]
MPETKEQKTDKQPSKVAIAKAKVKEKFTKQKGKGTARGLKFLSKEINQDIVKNHKIHHFVIPSRFRFYTHQELFNRLFVLSPDYKGQYGFSFAETGVGIGVGVSVDIAKLLASPLFPVELSADLEIKYDNLTEIVVLLSRMIETKRGILITPGSRTIKTPNPFCLQTFYGRKHRLKVKFGVTAGISLKPPLSLGKADLRFSLAQAGLSGSSGFTRYYYIDKTPGWYINDQDPSLEMDLENLMLSGLKVELKKQIVDWLRDHIQKLIHLKRRRRQVKNELTTDENQKLKELEEKLDALPKRTKFDRLKKAASRVAEGKIPGKKAGTDEILKKMEEIKEKLNELPVNFFSQNDLVRINNQIFNYGQKLKQAKDNFDDVVKTNELPPKHGSNHLPADYPFFQNLCFVKMNMIGPHSGKLNLSLLKFKLAKAKDAMEEEDQPTWTSDPGQKVLNTLKEKTVDEVTGKLNVVEKVKKFNIGSNLGVDATLHKTSVRTKYQTLGITKNEASPVIFTQLTHIDYLLTELKLGKNFPLNAEEAPPKEFLIDETKKEEEKDGPTLWESFTNSFIDDNVVEKINEKVKAKIKAKYDKEIGDKIDKTNVGKTRKKIVDAKFESEHQRITRNGKIYSTGQLSELGFGISIIIKKMEYSSVSAYWVYPKNGQGDKVKLERGSGISFGISIEKADLMKIARQSLGITKKTEKTNQNAFIGDFFRIAELLKVPNRTLKSFLHKFHELYGSKGPMGSEWKDDKKIGGTLLLESAHFLDTAISVEKENGEEKDEEKDFFVDLERTEESKAAFSVKDLFKNKVFKNFLEGNPPEEDGPKILPESIRVRHRIADSVNDNQTFSLGLDVGVGVNVNFSRYKSSGNEAIKDLLIYTVNNKSFHFNEFPLTDLDEAVPPTILLPHVFPETE